MNDAKGTARARIWGDRATKIEAALVSLDPDLAKLITEVAYDTVFDRPGLDLKTRELLAVAMLIAVGSERELETHLRGALNCGATTEELKETILQAAMYLGFPRAVAAMRVLKNTLEKNR